MKNINENIVWVSVKFSRLFLILSVILLAICIAIPRENKAELVLMSVFIWFGLITFVNTRDDDIYKKFWPADTEKEEGLYNLRSKSFWITAFIASSIMLILIAT